MLAIVIPYFKITFFEDTLKSLANQTDNRFKVYIGDDESPDTPTNLINHFQAKFNLTYKRFNKNIGGKSLVSHWNRCIDLVNDETWVMILGDDDILGENVVEEFYKNRSRFNDLNIVRYSSLKIDDSGSPISKIYFHPNYESSTDFLFRKTRSSLSEYVFKIESIRKIGFREFPLAWYSDVLGILEFSDFGQIFSINEALVKVRISERSISGSIENNKEKDLAKFKFYLALNNIHLNKFSKDQQNSLMNQMNKIYLNDKRKVFRFISITALYLKKVLLKKYFLFLFEILKSLINGFNKNKGKINY